MAMTDHVSDNIRSALLMLVPLAIAELAVVPLEMRREIAEEAGDIIAGKADQLMFASDNKPGVLGPMARGFAALAYQPGGVTALGLHACTEPHSECPCEERFPHHPVFGLVCEVKQ
ncbi:hypothetical protein ACFOY4_01475 [Actinomadura syzygii]|uniref:Uncharacterized protein n=1 Tax=Actinomadura syzygii TaxID=1427538 RepID=A0A5D0TSA1_9ACTN|nr:hypothetical protein [Actinomadura syzygii]TYC08583.1 hypothetical protein FXF65_37450 [Actinomadura syzygii]